MRRTRVLETARIEIRYKLSDKEPCRGVEPTLMMQLPNGEIVERTFPIGKIYFRKTESNGFSYKLFYLSYEEQEYPVGLFPGNYSEVLYRQISRKVKTFTTNMFSNCGYKVLSIRGGPYTIWVNYY